jgi:hypothetical protein
LSKEILAGKHSLGEWTHANSSKNDFLNTLLLIAVVIYTFFERTRFFFCGRGASFFFVKYSPKLSRHKKIHPL